MAKSLRKRFAVMAAVLIAALALPVIGSGTVHASSWETILDKLAAYSAISQTFNDYQTPRNSIKGDILIKKTGDTAFDSENEKVYQMKDGQDYTLGLKLNVKGVKDDMNGIKNTIATNPAVIKYVDEMGNGGSDATSVTGKGGLDIVGVRQLQSQMVANVKIPEGIDMSKVDLNKNKLQLGDNFGPYTDNESLKRVPIVNTDPYNKDKGYDLSGYKFQVTSAAYDEASRNLHIVMTLQIPKNYYGKSYDDVSQFNFGCLYSVVTGMPDNFTLEIPGITLDKNAKANTDMTFDGTMGQSQSKDAKEAVDSDCFMSSKVSYSGSFPVRVNWYASQFAGGEDAAKPAASAQGISLTVRKFVPKSEQPVTPKQAVQKLQKGIKTGDTTPIALYVILAAAAAGAAIVLIKHRPARH